MSQIIKRSDHVEATIALLEKIIQKLRDGVAPEDIGDCVVLIGRMMARKI